MKRVLAIVLALTFSASSALAQLASGNVGSGAQSALGAGAPTSPSFGQTRELRIQEGNARYADMALSGKVFTACNTAAQATSVNSPTATGLVLTNPPGSNTNILILEVLVSAASLPAGAATFIITGSTAVASGSMAVIHTTPLTVTSLPLGSSVKGVGLADSAATIPGNVIFRTLPGGPAATVASSTAWPPFIKDSVDGILPLGPGSVASIQSLTTAISMVACVTWYERALGTLSAN